MNYPKTKYEWWGLVNIYWIELSDILFRFLPNQRDAAYRAYVNDDPVLVDYLQQAWSNAPDNPGIHCIPGWHLLCDLCSERYVLDEVNLEVKKEAKVGGGRCDS